MYMYMYMKLSAYFFASFITNTGEPGTSVWTCGRNIKITITIKANLFKQK